MISSIKNKIKRLEDNLQLADDRPVIDLRELTIEELDKMIKQIEEGTSDLENYRLITESPDIKEMTEAEIDRELEFLRSLEE